MTPSLAGIAIHRSMAVEPRPVAVKCYSCGTRAQNVCGTIRSEDLERLSSIAVVISIDPGHCFISEGHKAEHFFNVTRGTATLYKQLPDGRRLITGFADPGHFLGLVVSETYAYSATALDGVRLCRYSRLKLKEFLLEFPALKTRLLEEASNELMVAQEQMLLLGRKSARERVASFLIGRTSTVPRYARGGPISVALPMTRCDIADYLGLSMETVSRTLGGLARDGLITIAMATRVMIRDHDALVRVATGAMIDDTDVPRTGARSVGIA